MFLELPKLLGILDNKTTLPPHEHSLQEQGLYIPSCDSNRRVKHPLPPPLHTPRISLPSLIPWHRQHTNSPSTRECIFSLSATSQTNICPPCLLPQPATSQTHLCPRARSPKISNQSDKLLPPARRPCGAAETTKSLPFRRPRRHSSLPKKSRGRGPSSAARGPSGPGRCSASPAAC